MSYSNLLKEKSDIRQPVRPNYFHGMMVTEYTFKQLTEYFNHKRWLINRHILGYGVVCGLDVLLTKDSELCVTSGIAIDKQGHEIILTETVGPLEIPIDLLPPPEECDKDEEYYLHLVICYDENLADPSPVLAGDCDVDPDCQPGAVREGFKIEFRVGKADKPVLAVGEIMPDVIRHNRIDYDELAVWVTNGCPDYPENGDITLANLCFTVNDEDMQYELEQAGIDITYRPLCYTNDVLFLMLLSLMGDAPRHRRK